MIWWMSASAKHLMLRFIISLVNKLPDEILNLTITPNGSNIHQIVKSIKTAQLLKMKMGKICFWVLQLHTTTCKNFRQWYTYRLHSFLTRILSVGWSLGESGKAERDVNYNVKLDVNTSKIVFSVIYGLIYGHFRESLTIGVNKYIIAEFYPNGFSFSALTFGFPPSCKP